VDRASFTHWQSLQLLQHIEYCRHVYVCVCMGACARMYICHREPTGHNARPFRSTGDGHN
jgi:hypothetical protein